MYLPQDPLRRFVDLFAALDAERGWFDDVASLRFAAMAAVTCPGQPHQIAQAIRAQAEELRKKAGWFNELSGPLRFLVAAVLAQHDDRPADFMAEVDRVRAMFREARLSRGGMYEVMAILILRGPDKKPVRSDDIARFQAIYEEMRKHHWWLTGVGDFPACAILVSQADSPAAIAQDIESIYNELHNVGFKRGDPLQTAANLLYLAHAKPSVIATRFHALAAGFRETSQRIWQSEYDELAILSFLDLPAERVVRQVLDYHDAVREVRPKPARALAFNLACSIAFVELVQPPERSAPIADVKAMIDLQALINAQQAAVMAGSMVAITAATSAAH